jgi:preprotein translocase subunit SecD
VTPNVSNVSGYTLNSSAIQADPQFATYQSTPAADDNGNVTVLLPATSASGGGRYVLGPAGVSTSAVKSASAQHIAGQWTVNLVLTGTGSVEWDALAKAQFHQMIGVDVNGQVISAPITQPTATSFTSFNGQVQISGSFTEHQANAIAAAL